jgi:hypothetical protein
MKAQLAAQGKIPKTIVFYSQGINDAARGYLTNTSGWAADTKDHFAKIRAELGDVPIVMTKFGDGTNGSGNFANYNAAIDSIVASTPRVYSVATADAQWLDGIHWSYSGYKLVAQRLIDVWASACGRASEADQR